MEQQLTSPPMRFEPRSLNFCLSAAFMFCICRSAIAGCAQGTLGRGGELRSGALHEQAVREIDDPHTGDRWLLVRAIRNPGGPGRLVLAGRLTQVATEGLQRPLDGRRPQWPAIFSPIIHAGERVILEQNSPLVRASLEAIALESAALGTSLNVRLAIGGKIVRACAVGRGRAALADRKESWR